MKRQLMLFLCAFVLTSTICFGQLSNQIMGSWTIVSLKYTYPNGSMFEKHEFKYPTLKIFTKAYYSYGNIYNDQGTLNAAGGGRYSIVGDTLTEKISYCLNPDFMGKESRFQIRIENNKLFESGTLPIGLKIEEEYKRIE